MTRYSVQPGGQAFVNDCGSLSFAKNMGKNICKNISIILSGKCRRKPLNHAIQAATDALKTTSKRVIQKAAEASSDFVVIKLLTELQNFQEICNKYLKKDIYLQKKDIRLLLI